MSKEETIHIDNLHLQDEIADAVIEVIEQRKWRDVYEYLDHSFGLTALASEVGVRAVGRLEEQNDG